MQPEIIERIKPRPSNPMLGSWEPTIGPLTQEVAKRICSKDRDPAKSEQQLKKETHHILSLCGSPQEDSHGKTGLVMGYVQSGKTRSFTALTAMARDNGYQVVIIMTGTKINLTKQSYERLKQDLTDGKKGEAWQILSSESEKDIGAVALEDARTTFKHWKDPNAPIDTKKTVVLVILKNQSHLKSLGRALQKIDLKGVPALIIDDEGDQASMNTKASKNAKKSPGEPKETSTIHQCILNLKKHLPHHTFLQYTATPQAPLFIETCSELSPNFVQLIEPGDGYTGGNVFFGAQSKLIKHIPQKEVPTKQNPFDKGFKLQALEEALMLFFLEATLSKHQDGPYGLPKTLSMMVHPAINIKSHTQYTARIKSFKDSWAAILKRAPQDTTRKEILGRFEKVYSTLKEAVHGLPIFADLVPHLPYRIKTTQLQEVNSNKGKTTHVDWDKADAWILVGAQVLDRGFTVEGLTVTYMPRGVGGGNADNLQQRARFFGYKQSYLGFCRVYLTQELLDFFEEYVEHEKNLIETLKNGEHLGKLLEKKEFKVMLNSIYKPTRRNILPTSFKKTRLGKGWVSILAPHYPALPIDENQKACEDFCNQYVAAFHDSLQGHPVACILLEEVNKTLIAKLGYTGTRDYNYYMGLRSLIEHTLSQSPKEVCYVYKMKNLEKRKRTLNQQGKIQPFEGRRPNQSSQAYKGDRSIKEDDHICIQLHNVLLPGTPYETTPIITPAFWIPARLSKDYQYLPKA